MAKFKVGNDRNQTVNGKSNGATALADRIGLWLRENFSTVVLPILAIIILALGIYVYSSPATPTVPENNSAAVAQDSDSSQPSPTTQIDADGDMDSQKVAAPDSVVDSPQPIVATSISGSFLETAQKGDGITHLARRAAKSYLAQSQPNETLTKEHKIFIEDFIQNKLGSRPLQVGETFEIQGSLIADAISAANQLTSQQLQHLSVYASSVLVL